MNLAVRSYQPFHTLDPDIPSNKWCFIAITDHDTSGDITKEQDFVGLMANWAGFGHLNAGQSFCLTPPGPPDPSFLDQVLQFVIDVVSFPAQLYELYKTVLPNVIGSFLTDVLNIPGCAPPEKGQPAGDCYGALVTAENIGLAALGLPPSLPDMHALLENGIDELASQTATQLNDAGIPVTKEQIASGLEAGKDELVQAFATVANQAQGFDCSVNGVAWCAFDGGARSPSVNVQATRPSSSTVTPPTRVCVDVAPGNTLYYRSCTNIPALAPGQSITVRIPLQTTVSVLASDTKYADKWMKAYEECNNSQLAPDEGCTKATNNEIAQTWESDATNGSIPLLVISTRTSPVPTETGSVWFAAKVGTTTGCGGNGNPQPEAAATTCSS